MSERNAPCSHSLAQLGIDVGALFVKAVLINADGEVVKTSRQAHKGEILPTLRFILDSHPEFREAKCVSLVGSQAHVPGEALGIETSDEVSALVAAMNHVQPGIRNIIDIGGGSLSLTQLKEDGSFVGYQTNTLCAAGTGSFLDEQVERLGLDYEFISDLKPIESPPSIAARCTVFAKSDLIHRQQEGYNKEEMWSGLCRGLVHTILMTLFKGRAPSGRTAVVGGVTQNPEVMRWLSQEMDVETLVPKYAGVMSALGGALLAEPVEGLDWGRLDDFKRGHEGEAVRSELKLERSNYPSFDVLEEYLDDDNEVRVSRWPEGSVLRGTIGIDVGSTSTKLAMVDENEEVLLDIYRKTGGEPIEATKKLFVSLEKLAKRKGLEIDILGVGTTGSGRKLVGAVVGADRVVNEISAHVTGAMKTDPAIDTIFEIGGQDSKYILTRDGALRDSNMNYVCAAGTGSFVEELSRKMGFDLQTLGDEVMGVVPPVTSDRCTVFMEQDARALLRKGYDRKEVMGAILYSVVQNYLNKVVGNRHVSRSKVFFQGATARNKGLVAAFENLVGVEVVVSPYCHVMGCYGVALITGREMAKSKEQTTFVGLDFKDRKVNLEQDVCELCANRCAITRAHIDGVESSPSWGYLCGRDPEESRMRVAHEYDAFRQRNRLWRAVDKETRLPDDAPVISMPRALLTHTYYPFWKRFFFELGYRLKLSKATDRSIIEQSSDWVGSDYCFPVKLAHGHVRDLLENEKVDRIFIPYMVSAEGSEKTTESFFCPYNVGLPAMIHSAMVLNGQPGNKLLRATVDFRWTPRRAAARLHEDLGASMGVQLKQVLVGWEGALATQKRYEAGMEEQGTELLKGIQEDGKPAVVLLGRPYNLYDGGANLDLPEKLANLGIPVIPLEMLPLEKQPIGPDFENMFWNFGRKIIEAARYVAATPGLYACYFSNFSCGPDSFIQTYVESIMGDKPMLILELDEHSADAGYITRLEAFADVLHSNPTQTVEWFQTAQPNSRMDALGKKTLWVPPMGEPQPKLVAAALRNQGYNAKALPFETAEAFQMGKRESRGGECLPCPATFGTFLKSVEDSGDNPNQHALFMPTASGPCRFGQYCTQNRIALDRMGWEEIPVVSWSSTDSYAGLSTKGRRLFWWGLVLGDILYKIRCRILPYEIEEGRTEKTYLKWMGRLEVAFEKGEKLETVVEAMRDDFLTIPTTSVAKPLVGVVGEIYVRNNPFTNQNVVRRIEKAGGEAWLAPITEWVLYTAHMEAWFKGHRTGGFVERLSMLAKNKFLLRDEAYWMKRVHPLLEDRVEPSLGSTLKEGEPYFPMDFEGEAIITIGRAIEYMKDGASLVVNCAPFGCMPGSMTSGVFQEVEEKYGVPVANMFYDGEGDLNDRIDTYLANLRQVSRVGKKSQSRNVSDRVPS